MSAKTELLNCYYTVSIQSKYLSLNCTTESEFLTSCGMEFQIFDPEYAKEVR